MNNENEEKKEHVIQWHPAFFAAIQLIFRNETAHLEFEAEHTLNTKPLLIDVLVVKKPSNEVLKSVFGRIFKGHNIIEYKSPQDQLGIDAYLKAYAYACLYKVSAEHEDAIKLEDVTLTLVRDRKPEKLLTYLREHDYRIKNPYAGIYYVEHGGMFPTQIVVGKELQDEELVWLKAMAPSVGIKTIASFMEMAANELNQGRKNLLTSILDVVLAVNKEKAQEVKGDANMCEALRELMKDEFNAEIKALNDEFENEKENLKNEFENEKKNLKNKFANEQKQKTDQAAVKAIQMGLADDQILTLLGITKAELDALKKNM